MKQIAYIQPVPIVDTFGQPGLVRNKAVMPQLEYFFELISYPQFAGEKMGIDALALAVTTRIELENQRDLAPERGFWLLEDNRAEAILRAAEKGQPNTNYAVTLMQLCEPIKAMKDYNPPKQVDTK